MTRIIVAPLLLLLIGCGSQAPQLRLPTAAPARDAAALAAAAEAYYSATDPAGMREALAAAKAAGAQTALYHELAADLARFEDREPVELDHLLAALLDPAGDAPLFLMNRLVALNWTLSERGRIWAVLSAVRRDHPRADVRALAAWISSHMAHLEGRDAAQKAALAEVSGRLPLALIGPWDNDQGKGFDAEYPPEREVDLSKRYLGSRLEVGWRTEYPIDPRGKVHLHAVLEPTRWQAAYAASAVEVQAAGDYELRLSTSDPIKVWVNEVLVFTGRRMSVWTFDGAVIPVKLRAGANQILIKTAHDSAGAWMLVARLTGAEGSPLPATAFKPTRADTPVADGVRPASEPLAEERLIMRRVAKVADGVRKGILLAAIADDLGLTVPRVKVAEALQTAKPDALRVKYLTSSALWDNQERGRTADLLNDLAKAHGDELPLLGLKQARFWRQQKLADKARKLLTGLIDKHPEREGAAFALADLLGSEKWHEERCQLLEGVHRRRPDLVRARIALANCYEKLRFYPRAEALYTSVLAALPNSYQALQQMHWLRQGNDDFTGAARYARRWTAAWPHDRGGWAALGETLRRAGKPADAMQTWQRLIEMAPTAPDGYQRQARLAMQQGDRDRALALWRAALLRDPENDSLANRLEYLAPEKAGPWLADVPTEADLEAAVQLRETVEPMAGADMIYLVDDEVTALSPDGSTINVVTLVAHAVNQAGRDKLTRMGVRSSRARVLQAYAVDAAGRRLEASSIRGRTVRFRQLGIGSTVVLQYRTDGRPDGYLAHHMARQWWFQAPTVQTRISRWVVWAPKGTKFLEEGRGDFERAEEVRGEFSRLSWTAKDTPPVHTEPKMPTLQEVAANLAVSTVPDWATFWKWEKALLRDAFRTSPELERLAEDLFRGTTTKAERVDRIHAYLMTAIRYQQDYEGRIAGVKPHAAPVVVARQYGDCKDKAVLFITLARMADIDVHFALVRTRDAGPVRTKVPMQQFNHAIVYVPAQPGIAEGRFYDPTVDALDVDVLRHDDQGTTSLVYDPQKTTHRWIRIPYQAPSVDYTLADSAIVLNTDGSATGEMELTSHGRLGSLLRRGARNPTRFAQLMQQQVGRTFAGAKMTGHETVQVTSVLEPAKVRLGLEAPTLGRREGKELRMKLPIPWTPQEYFSLAEREHAVLLGAPRTLRWQVSIELPEGARIKRLPEPLAIDTECISLTRSVARKGKTVVAEQRVEMKCERIPVEQYAAQRAQSEQMLRRLDEELVFDVSRVKAPAKAKPVARR